MSSARSLGNGVDCLCNAGGETGRPRPPNNKMEQKNRMRSDAVAAPACGKLRVMGYELIVVAEGAGEESKATAKSRSDATR